MSRSHFTSVPAVVAALGCAALVGCAGNAQPPGPQAAAAPSAAIPGATPVAAKSVCIQTYLIDHTEVPNDTTILFHMKGGAIWKNTLPFSCPDLKFQGGFQYTTDIDEICSNLQTIRVIEQGGGPFLGAVCQLGEFTPYTPPPKVKTG